VATLADLIRKVRPFAVIGEKTFACEEGLKIGVAVCSHWCNEEEAFLEVNLDFIDIGNESGHAVRSKGVKQVKMEAILGENDSAVICALDVSPMWALITLNTVSMPTGDVGVVLGL